MATQTDTGQLKKLGFALLGLGIVMALVGVFLSTSWQIYAGAAAAVVGLGIAVFALKKG